MKEELNKSREESDGFENIELNQKAKKMSKCEEAVSIVREYKEIIKSQRRV